MKTTIDIPDEMLHEAMRHAKVKTKRQAVVAALTEYNRRRAMADLVKYSGAAENLMTVQDLLKLRATDRPLPSKTASEK